MKLLTKCLLILASLIGANASAQQAFPVIQSGHNDEVKSLFFSPKGDALISIGADKQVIQWDLTTSRHFAPFSGIFGTPQKGIFFSDSQFLLLSSQYVYLGNTRSHQMQIWDTVSTIFRNPVLLFDQNQLVVVFKPGVEYDQKLLFYYPFRPVNSRMFFSSSVEGILKGEVMAISWSQSDHHVYVGDDSGSLISINPSSRESSLLLHREKGYAGQIAVNASGMVLSWRDLYEETNLHRLFYLPFAEDHKSFEGIRVLQDSVLPIQIFSSAWSSDFLALGYWKHKTGAQLIRFRADHFPGTLTFDIPTNTKAHCMEEGNGNGFVALGFSNAMILNLHQATMQPVQQLHKPAVPVNQFLLSEQAGRLYTYSRHNRLVTTINLQNGNYDTYKTRASGILSAEFFADGTFFQHSDNLQKLYRYSPAGQVDSANNPFSRFWEFRCNERYQSLMAPGLDGDLVLFSKTSLSPILKVPADVNLFTGAFGFSSDEHVFHWLNLGDTIHARYMNGATLTNLPKDSLFPEQFGVPKTFDFVDSGRLMLVASTQLDLDGGSNVYRLVLRESKPGGKVLKVIPTSHEVRRFMPGRKPGEIAMRTEQTEKVALLYFFNFHTFILDSMQLDEARPRRIQWLKNGQRMIALCNSGLFETDEFGQLVVMDARGKRLMKYAQGMSGFAFLNEVGGSMMASKGSSDLIAYQLPHPEGLAMVPGKMLELRYNRPRQVLSLLGYSDSFTLKAYDAAWSKRMSNVLPPPADEWQNRPLVSTDFKRGTLATSQTSVPVDIDFHAVADSVVSLHIVHNGCPVNGTAGIRFAKASWKGVNTWQLDLVPGKNTLSLTVKDKKGRESIPYYLEIFCADDEMEPQTYFIGIGVSHYRDAKNNLVYASKDIRDISHYMSGLSHCTIDTFVNENALWSNLLGVKQKLAKLKPGDRVVVAFSGHGLLDKNLDLYLGLHSVNFQNPAQGGLKLEQLISLLDSTPACQKLLLLDACHSGEIDKEGKIQAVVTTIKPGAKGSQNLLVKSNKTVDAFEFMKARFEDAVNENGTVIISAAGGKEYALENDVYSNGIFTFALLQCLQKLQGDTDHDGKISIEELKQFLLTRVPEYSGGRQKPTMRRENAFNNWIF